MKSFLYVVVAISSFSSTNLSTAYADYTQKNAISMGFHVGGFTTGYLGTDPFRLGERYSFTYGRTFSENSTGYNRLNVGIKFQRFNASNGTISFYRYPVELIHYVKNGNTEFGLGLLAHLNSVYIEDITSPVYYFKANFGTEIGMVLQMNFAISNHESYGLRYEIISYDGFDGNNFAFMYEIRF